MVRSLFVILMCLAALSTLGQTPSSKYQPGTITAVKTHDNSSQPEAGISRYDVSVRVGNTLYVVLYTPPDGSNTAKFEAGIEWLVMVGSTTLTFNDTQSRQTEAPILSRTALPPQPLDWTRVCGQYFSLKLQHLTEILALTDSQQTEIKPILEQEAGEVDEICFNPVVSRTDTLNSYEKILRTSDQKLKPILSTTQLQKLHDMRKEQKQDLKKIIAELDGHKPATVQH
jgi:hypothetical protein